MSGMFGTLISRRNSDKNSRETLRQTVRPPGETRNYRQNNYEFQSRNPQNGPQQGFSESPNDAIGDVERFQLFRTKLRRYYPNESNENEIPTRVSLTRTPVRSSQLKPDEIIEIWAVTKLSHQIVPRPTRILDSLARIRLEFMSACEDDWINIRASL